MPEMYMNPSLSPTGAFLRRRVVYSVLTPELC